MTPLFLGLSEVLEIHRDQIERYGGEPGIRDVGLLQSAIGMPATGYKGQYLHETLFDKAAAYLFHIVNNHAFIDGNKRTGAVCAVVFLLLNGIEVDADEEEFEHLVLSVTSDKVGKQEIAEFFRNNSAELS